MSASAGRVPFTFPVAVQAGATERYRQEVPEDGRIERLQIFYPKNSKTDIELTPVLNGDPINQSDATESSPSIPDFVVGSEILFDWDIEFPVEEGDEIGVNATNTHGSSDLDGFVAFIVDYRGGLDGQ